LESAQFIGGGSAAGEDMHEKTNDKVVVVLGAGSFIGSHLLAALALRQDLQVRALVRQHVGPTESEAAGIQMYKGDLLQPEALSRILAKGCTVINLAYLRQADLAANLEAITNLAEACAGTQIKRLIHCSTATVAGKTKVNPVDESSPCEPCTNYDATKCAIERLLLDRYKTQFELAIVRPSAVFGPNGKNLLKLAHHISKGNRLANYVKSCLSHSRSMNLVCVDNVVAAILFLSDTANKLSDSIYIVSDDDDARNNYRSVEKHLMQRLGTADYKLPVVPLPHSFLKMILKLSGRSCSDIMRVYLGRNLTAAGFVKPVGLKDGLDRFAAWYRERLDP